MLTKAAGAAPRGTGGRHMYDIAAFKQRLAQGGAVSGPFMKTGDAAFVEIAGYAGFDFCILDTEHGPADVLSLQDHVRAAQVAGILPIVRVNELSETAIGKALDIGAAGVQVPQVTDAEQARQAVACAKFHPQGSRGVCRFVRAARYSATDRFTYFQQANDTLVVLQLEGQQALENLDAILQVPGVDILFIGPYDLSQSLGLTGQTDHPRVVAQMMEITRRAAAQGRVVGTFLDRVEDAERWRQAGVQYLSYSTDMGIFLEACRAAAGAIRGQ